MMDNVDLSRSVVHWMLLSQITTKVDENPASIFFLYQK